MVLWRVAEVAVPAVVVSLVASLPSSATTAPAEPDAHETAMRLGRKLHAQGLYDQAAEAFEQAAFVNPRSAAAFAELGRARLAQSQFEPAIRAFERALVLRPTLDDARYNLAYTYRQAGAFGRASQEYRTYLQRAPNDADAYFGLATSLKEAGELRAAADSFERYAEVEKRPSWGRWIEQARAEARTLRALAERAPPAPRSPPSRLPAPRISHRPRSPMFTSGLAHLQRGDYAAAKKDLLGAEALHPTDAFVLSALAGAHLGLNETEQAERVYRRAFAEAGPTMWGAIYFGLGEAARVKGQLDAAQRFYEKVLALPESPEAIRRAAQTRWSAVSQEYTKSPFREGAYPPFSIPRPGRPSR